MTIQSRQVIMSGQNKYVPLNEFEKACYLLEFFWTDLTTQFSQDVNAAWTPPRKFFGRVCFQAREYVVYEKLINFNNELLHTETNAIRYLQHHASCMQIESNWLLLDALVSTRLITDTLLPVGGVSEAVTAAAYLVLRTNAQLFLNGQESSFTQQIIQQQHRAYSQRPTPRHVLDGFSYSMANFASGQLTIRGYGFDEACVFPNTTIDSNPDNRAAPPSSAGGDDVAGSAGNVPSATGTSDPPPPGQQSPPSSEDPSPAPPPGKPGIPPDTTLDGVGYIVNYGFEDDNGLKFAITSELLGPISGWETSTNGFNTVRSLYQRGSVPGAPRRLVRRVEWFPGSDFPNQRFTGFYVKILRRA